MGDKTLRIEVAIDIPERTPEVDRLGYRLVRYLEHNARLEEPKTAVQIMAALGLSTDSVIQGIVHDLRGHHGVLVGSNVHKPAGYYLARNVDEIMPTFKRLHSIAMSNLYAWSGLKRGIVAQGQGRLLL